MAEQPTNCPECGCGGVKKIFYGRIDIRTEEGHEAFKSRYVWGGPVLNENAPLYYCPTCYHRWGGRKFPMKCPKCKGDAIREVVQAVVQCGDEEELLRFEDAFHLGQRLGEEKKFLIITHRCSGCGATFEFGWSKRSARRDKPEGAENG